MATNVKSSHSPEPAPVRNNLVHDVRSEVAHEAGQIRDTGAPVTRSHSDHVVRRHVFGLSVGFFVAILVFLALVLIGVLIFGRH
jgi:hypothetical protein